MSSLCYVNECTVKTLCLSTHKPSLKVSMAVDSLQGTISRHYVELTFCNLGVMKDLCCDILLGKDFQRQHRRVIFEYDGTRPELAVSSLPPQTCAVAAAKPECLSLVYNLTPDCRPVSIPSHRYSGPDAAFIESEVKTGKRRLCVGYSQTINLYTVLDAYPLPRIEDMILKLAKLVFSPHLI